MTLRAQVIRGSVYLALREGAGTLLSLGGMLLLTRLIGPANYGIYVSSHTFLAYLVGLSEVGVGVFLIRLAESKGDEVFDQAFTLLLCLSAIGVALALLCLPLLGRVVRIDGFVPAAIALAIGLPITHMTKVPMARLERQLDYKRVAGIELTSHLAYYVVGLAFAFRGAGVWAPVLGWWAEQLTQFVLAYRTGYRPRLRWDPARVREMLSYGASYSTSIWIQQLRTFVNPLVLGRLLGPAAVGYVALAVRLIDSLGFVKVATTRISIAALARLQGDRARLARAITEGMTLQVLAVGPLLLGFAVVAPFVLPLVFGAQWLPTLDVFPPLAAAYALGAMFVLHSSALVTLHRNLAVAAGALVQAVVLAVGALLLVPRFGAVGYGWAELATVPTYLVWHALLVRHVERMRYTHALMWLAALALPLLTFDLVRFTWPLALLPLFWPSARREIMGVVEVVLKRRVAGPPESAEQVEAEHAVLAGTSPRPEP